MLHSRTIRTVISIALGLVFVLVVGALRVGLAYWSIERDEFDPDSARNRLEAMTSEETEEAHTTLPS